MIQPTCQACARAHPAYLLGAPRLRSDIKAANHVLPRATVGERAQICFRRTAPLFRRTAPNSSDHYKFSPSALLLENTYTTWRPDRITTPTPPSDSARKLVESKGKLWNRELEECSAGTSFAVFPWVDNPDLPLLYYNRLGTLA
ncbi:hypothetical protein L2E82_40129 [Cichorium intybus]|uniref:Uncharacterized protein n=4 Tax=Cichorium intybus TaxID=13427 RepID=A0ACB9APJ0_CICIN|nr:hypothetical protein L2E82_40126 [Cichorium intybus]KAI3710349.1 hypothetical protein L2E82_40127 [Cichorium intybus]KAI3710350.1 hypothetical protein L2E82_40128 [Cichorium intybus]KAI3710351.1 hypothetical protein L2E82_40129 [Cichorium intybus]